VTRVGLWIDNWYIGLLQIVATGNYSSFANSHILPFTMARTKSFSSSLGVAKQRLRQWRVLLPRLRQGGWLSHNNFRLGLDCQAKVTLRPTVSRPVALGVKTSFCYCQTVAILSMWGAFSDERLGLSFVAVIISSTCRLYLQLKLAAILLHEFNTIFWWPKFCLLVALSWSAELPLWLLWTCRSERNCLR
jgi:hypothetical protein